MKLPDTAASTPGGEGSAQIPGSTKTTAAGILANPGRAINTLTGRGLENGARPEAESSLNARRRQVRYANKRRRIALQEAQDEGILYWTRHQATSTTTPIPRVYPENVRGQMCRAGTGLKHPAAKTLLDYATQGCPSKTGPNWTMDQLEAAVARGPHESALLPKAREQHLKEVEDS